MTIPDPGHVPSIVPNVTPIQAEWGNAIRDRIVHRFATVAARDAALVTPAKGTLCWVDATARFYWCADDSPVTWLQIPYLQPPTASLVGGLLLSSTVVNTAGVDVAALALPPVDHDRFVRVEGSVLLTAVSGTTDIQAVLSGTATIRDRRVRLTATGSYLVNASGVLPAGQTGQASLRVAAASGSVTLSSSASSTYHSMAVEVWPA